VRVNEGVGRKPCFVSSVTELSSCAERSLQHAVRFCAFV
jgi:hypothetical protein